MAKAKQLPSGNWRVQVYNGIKPDGRPEYISFTANTKKEAEFQALQFQLHYKEVSQNTSAMTLAEAMDRYINGRDGILSPSTIRSYRAVRRNSIQGLMGIQLKKLSISDIQIALNEEAKTHTPKTVRNIYGLLTATLREYHAQLARELEQHPPTLPQKIVRERTILEPDQVGRLLQAVQGNVIEIPVLLAVWMGMRQSEILGLQWEDIDFQAGTVYIHQAKVRDSASKLVLKTTKTTASTRTLHLPAYIMEKLKAAQAEADSDFVVTMTGNNLYGRLKRLLKRNGLPSIRFHDLRHCNASIMLAIGVPEIYAQRRGGWSTDHTMKTVYTHLLNSTRSAADDTIDTYFSHLIASGDPKP